MLPAIDSSDPIQDFEGEDSSSVMQDMKNAMEIEVKLRKIVFWVAFKEFGGDNNTVCIPLC